MIKVIKIKLKPHAIPPTRGFKGDWYDLFTYGDCRLDKGLYGAIPLGVAMELPKGYEAIIAPRSSTFKRYGVLAANSISVIDEEYKGDDDYWHFPVYAMQNIFIPSGTRLCQFRIIEHQPPCCFEVVDHLNNENRGGFGTTGE